MNTTTVTRTFARELPNGDYIEAVAEERDDSGKLSPGFSVTGSIWERRGSTRGSERKRLGIESDIGGCIHDEILAAFPKLAPVVRVHLASPDGLPMHAKANGWYFYSGNAAAYERERIAEGKDYGYSRLLENSDHERAAQALHISPDELPTGLAESEFGDFVDSLAARYAADAQAAREIIAGRDTERPLTIGDVNPVTLTA